MQYESRIIYAKRTNDRSFMAASGVWDEIEPIEKKVNVDEGYEEYVHVDDVKEYAYKKYESNWKMVTGGAIEGNLTVRDYFTTELLKSLISNDCPPEELMGIVKGIVSELMLDRNDVLS